MNCLTPVPLIMNSFLKAIQVIYSDCSFKFDPSLSYEESLRGLRAIRSSLPITQEQIFPLFTYSLGPIKPFIQGRRHFPVRKNVTAGTAEEFIGKLGQIEIMWKLYYADIINFTTMEVFYMAEKSINDVKEISVSLPQIGDFRYFITWEPLDQVEYNKTDSLYMSASGKATLVGEFLIGLNVSLPLITEINIALKDKIQTSLVYDLMQITPTGVTHPPIA